MSPIPQPKDPSLRAIRPKRPIYWSALAVVAISGAVAGVSIWQWEPVQALAVVNPIVALWVAMARGFFGGDETPTPTPKEAPND